MTRIEVEATFETTKLVEVALVVVPFVAVKLIVVIVPVAVTFETDTIFPEKMALPWTEKRDEGVEVPTPTLPEVFSTTSLLPKTVRPPAKVEVEILVETKLVTVVVPPERPPPTPQLMQTFPTERLPDTFRLPAKLEVAVVPWTVKCVVMVVVASWTWPDTKILPEKVEVPAPVEEKRPAVATLLEELIVISSGTDASVRPDKDPEMVGLLIVGELKVILGR